MKLLNSSEKRVVCANPDSAFRYFAWPTMAYLPDGTLAMTASGFRLAHICPFGKAVICYSKDEGATWTRPAPVIDTPLDDRDAGITAFGNGRVILTSFNNTIRQQRVWNHAPIDGHDWSESPRRRFVEAYLDEIETRGDEERFLGSTYKISEDGGYTFGKLRRAPVTAPHGPCRLNDGSLLYVGRRFSANDEFDGGETPFIQVCRLNENDEFEVVSSIENIVDEADGLLQSCEPHAIQLPDGRMTGAYSCISACSAMAFRSRCSPCISLNPATADIRSPSPAACSPAAAARPRTCACIPPARSSPRTATAKSPTASARCSHGTAETHGIPTTYSTRPPKAATSATPPASNSRAAAS